MTYLWLFLEIFRFFLIGPFQFDGLVYFKIIVFLDQKNIEIDIKMIKIGSYLFELWVYHIIYFGGHFEFLILGRKQLRDNKMMNKTEFSMKNYMLIQIFIKKY